MDAVCLWTRSLFVDTHQIEDLELAERILGYDKPFDIRKYTGGVKGEKKD